jgi:uncharacterized membrane protein
VSQVVSRSQSAPPALDVLLTGENAGFERPLRQRWTALDTFRGLAVLLMIQGHTFTVLAREGAFTGWWVRLYTLFHGLTAPMFLVGGGLAYGMVSSQRRSKRDGSARERVADARIVRRSLMLIAIGYLLQVPQVPLLRLEQYPAQFRAAFAIGPLQLVGASLLVCELIWGLSCFSAGLLAGRAASVAPVHRAAIARAHARWLYLGMLGALLLTVAVCSPWVWQARISTTWSPPLGMWVDGHGGSLFPVFPWAAFFFVGVLASGLVPVALRIPRVTAASLIGLTAGLAWGIYSVWSAGGRLQSVYGEHEFWHANPMYVTFRAALVLLMLGVLILVEPACQWARGRFPNAGNLFDVLSRQSLVAYVTHLLVLYGTPFTTGLTRFGRVFELGESSLIFAVVAFYTLAIAVLWEHLKPAELVSRIVRRILLARRNARGLEVDRIGEGKGHRVSAPEQELEAPSTIHHG